MNVDGGIQISDLAGIVRRRGKLAAFVALLVFLAAYWLAMALPNVYTSYATVLVEPQAVAEDLVKAGVAESDLNQRLHLMTAQILSRPRLSRIIDELGLYAEQSKYMLREEIIDLMRNRIRVEPVVPDLQQTRRNEEAQINQFKIFFEDYNPKIARDVAQHLANDFIETHIEQRVQTTQKSLEFIQSELERLADRIKEVEGKIAQVKNENPGKLPEDMAANQRRLERVLGDLSVAQRAYAEATSDEGFYRSQLAAASSMAAPNGQVSPGTRLEALKLQLGEYESKGYTDKHPDVIKTRAEIEQLEKTIKEGAEGAPTSLLAQQTEAEMRRAALRRASAKEEIDRLRRLADEIQSQIGETPAVAEQLDALNRDYEHLFASFQDFSNRNLEATVQAQLERRQLGEQFRVLEPAYRASEPSAPNRFLILALGVMFALALGAGAALVAEAVDTSAHDARQLQTRIQLPVLAAIPQIWLESDRVRQRRQRLRTALATGSLVLFALVGGAANYFWVNGVPGFLKATAGAQAESPAVPAPQQTEG